MIANLVNNFASSSTGELIDSITREDTRTLPFYPVVYVGEE